MNHVNVSISININVNSINDSKIFEEQMGKENPIKVVNDISKGKLLPTQSFLVSKNRQYRYEIIKAGGIDKILEFILQSNQDFKDVLPSASEEEEDEDDSLYVTCPSLWIEILSCFCKDGFLNSQSPASSSSSPLQPLAAVQLEELQKEIQYKVMNNISGLFQDMSPEYFKSNNVTPKLFGSKDYWIKSLLPFSALLSNLLTSTSNNGTMGNFLIKQPKIKQFLLQITYLDFAFDYDFDSDNNNNNQVMIDIVDFQKKKNRSDNNRISKVDIIGSSQSYCAVAIKTLTDNAEKQAVAQMTTSSNVNNKKYALLGEFAVTPIIVYPTTTDDNDNNNKNYGGSFLRFGTGLIELLENKSSSSHHDSGGSVSDGWYQGGGYSSTLYLFLKLYEWGGRISGKFIGINSCVSSNLVAICSKHIHIYTSKRKDQSFIENVSIGLVVLYASLMTPIIVDPKNTGQQRQAPIDYNVANAIYGGLMEYCLDVCDCCYNCSNDGSGRVLITQLQRLLKIIYLTVQFPDTKKAIRSKEKELMAKVERVKDRLPYLFSCVPMIEKIIDAVSTTTTTTTTTTRGNNNEDDNSTKNNNNNKEFPTCECCSEKCDTKNKMSKKCSFCRSVIYCSSDCLQKNWPLHQKQCVIIRKYPTPKSKITIVEEGKEIFTEQIQKILLQASLKGFSILYCLVVIDMAESTPLLRTLTIEQFIQSYHINMAPDDDDILQKSKEIFERNKNDGSLTVSMIGFTEVGLSISVLTFPPDSVPMHLFDHSSEVQHTIETDRWPAAQRDVAGKSLLNADDGLKKLQSNPQLWQASLLKLMKP